MSSFSNDPVVWIKHMGSSYTIEDGSTLEFSVDLIEANPQGATVGLAFTLDGSPGDPLGYGIYVDSDVLLIAKTPQQAFLRLNDHFRRNNVQMVLRMTGAVNDVIITARLLDLQSGTVLFERTVRDTAEADTLNVGTDSPPASYIGRTGKFDLTLWHRSGAPSTQETSVATLDNARVVEYDSPLIDIERVVQLSWPITGKTFVVEGAEHVEGPWERIDGTIVEETESGLQTMTISPYDPASFFRLLQN